MHTPMALMNSLEVMPYNSFGIKFAAVSLHYGQEKS